MWHSEESNAAVEGVWVYVGHDSMKDLCIWQVQEPRGRANRERGNVFKGQVLKSEAFTVLTSRLIRVV